MNQRLRIFAPLDALVVAAFLCGLGFCIPLFHALQPATVAVFRDNRKIAVYPLAENRTFTVKGREGPVTIAIQDKRVRVVSSNCPRGICMHAAAGSAEIRQIVCVPNHIIIELQAKKEGDLDGVTE
jgi:hypothetical protein